MKFEMENKPLNVFNFSSLTDIVLLLLIFFLLTSQFVIQTGVKVKLPGSKTNEQTLPSQLIVTITPDSKIYLGSDLVGIDGLPMKLESASQKELGEITLKDKTSITRLVDILEKKNLVVRVEDQIDHRIKRVILTNAGKQLFFDVLPIMEKTREEVRKDISDQDIETFKKVLSSIIVNLEDENDKPS